MVVIGPIQSTARELEKGKVGNHGGALIQRRQGGIGPFLVN